MRRALRVTAALAMLVSIVATAGPAHADPCDVNVKDVVVIDLINCG